jgi:GT2 family glycosyltransferase
MRAPTVSVVVISYNAREVLRSCLNVVTATGHEVAVIDNASSDGSPELIKTEFPSVRLTALDTNVGFGAGANTGVRTTQGEYILILNPDAWPLAGAVDHLVDRAERAPRTALLGPQLVDARGVPQRSVIRQPQGGAALALWTVFPDVVSNAYVLWRRLGLPSTKEVRDGEFLMGAALLLRRVAIEQVGGFDESFFMFNEEADLCFRLRRAGWQVEFVPAATFVHLGGMSTRTAPEEMYREQIRSHLRFLAKHGSMDRAAVARRLLVFSLRLRALTGGGSRERTAAAWLASTDPEELLRPHP